MRRHGVRRHAKAVSDLGVCATVREAMHHLNLACGQALHWLAHGELAV
jgi:hypothetical protein